MCNLYAARKTRDEVRGLFKISDNRALAGTSKNDAAGRDLSDGTGF